MSNITQLKDKNGNNIYPITSDKLVLDERGISIGEKLSNHLNNHPEGFSGNYNDLSNKPLIPNKTSELINDTGFITIEDLDTSQNHIHTNIDILNGISNNDISNWNDKEVKGHTHDSLYASKSSEHIHHNKTVIDNITSKDISKWDNKSDFDGNYNNLTNKPSIPSVDGLATEVYVNSKVASIVDSSPEALDTLNELAAALGNDPNFATTVSTQIGTKADKNYVDLELTKKSDVHSHPYKSDSYVPTWGEISNKPISFNPSSHIHDEYIKYDLLSGNVVVPSITILREE